MSLLGHTIFEVFVQSKGGRIRNLFSVRCENGCCEDLKGLIYFVGFVLLEDLFKLITIVLVVDQLHTNVLTEHCLGDLEVYCIFKNKY